MSRVAVWWLVVVTAVVCGVAWSSSPCDNKDACSTCTQTQNCMWCGQPGNFIGENGRNLPRCIQHVDNVPSEWREACGADHIHGPAVSFSEECNFHGRYQCGECMCDPGYLGSKCECPPGSVWGDTGSFNDSTCRQTRTSPVCNGRGTCVCGTCECDEQERWIVSGEFCECTNFLCPLYNGQLCGGSHHGECRCNKCVCHPGWTGEDCMCEDGVQNCINPDSGEVCSGHGDCECNQCKCHEGRDGRYSGKYCEDCPTCKGKCVPYKPCVQCQVFRTGELTPEECERRCTEFNATAVTILVEEEGERLCTFFDENDCRFKFVYDYDDKRRPVVRVQHTLECPPPGGSYVDTIGARSHGSLPYPSHCIGISVTFISAILLVGFRLI